MQALTAPLPAYASPPADNLAIKAIEQELHRSRAWQTLLHYRPGLSGGMKSMVDDPAFFLSPQGKTSPEDELRATIRSFFTSAEAGDNHPICRFPARLKWLRQELSISDKDLPTPDCPEFNKYMAMVKPDSAALVFPEAHINSPASMFGHTLIRLESGGRSRMLSYSISYAAALPDDPGPLFALKGVFGAYKGHLTALPYYEKIKEYTHMEARDIWEYGLNLSPEEVRRMALHIWELRDMYWDYYFFDDNCAYILLFLIEAARPEARLTDGFFYWVLPTDTIGVLRDSGLINPGAFRPSKATRMAHMESVASEGALKKSLELTRGNINPAKVSDDPTLSDEEKIISLDLAAEYTQHLYMKGRLERDEYTARYLEVLSARSRLGKREYNIPAPALPESGHDTMKFSLGAGRQGREDYAFMRWRLLYHGLTDPGKGYKPGAGIEALKAEIRHFPDTGETVLERFMIADTTSLSPMGNFLKPVSWRIRLGAERETTRDGSRTPVILEGGAGLTTGLGKGGLAYVMLEPSLKMGGSLRDNYALGGGLSMGALAEFSGRYRMMLAGRAYYYPAGDTHGSRSVRLRQTLRLSRNASLGLDYTRSWLDGLYRSDSSLGLNIYF